MKYNQIKALFDPPKIWRKPQKDKLKTGGVSFASYLDQKNELELVKNGVKFEINDNLSKQMEVSKSKGELNQRLDAIFEHYSRGVIPTNDFDPQFLLPKTNRNTLSKKLQPWCKNLVHNIPTIIESSPTQELLGKFQGVPAFVVMAGPSLKNNREQLLAAKGKSVIICVDTSLRPLLNVGVVPDICVTHDANPNGCKFFLSGDHELNRNNVNLNKMNENEIGVAFNLLKADKDRLKYSYDTIGLFVNYCHPMTLLCWNGSEKRFYGVNDPSLPVYDVMAACTNYTMKDEKLVPENKGRIVGGSSVGHVATYIAVLMGCNPISMLGLDLSYPGGKTYIDDASNQKSVKGQKLIDMFDLSGNKVKTNLSMLSYKMVFENTLPQIFYQNTNLVIYNCTENDKGEPTGILELGAEPKPLKWVIENKCRKEVNIKQCLKQEKAKVS